MEKSTVKPNGLALVPFLIFVVGYLGIGVTLVAKGDPMGFYGFKGPIAVIIGIIAAFIFWLKVVETQTLLQCALFICSQVRFLLCQNKWVALSRLLIWD